MNKLPKWSDVSEKLDKGEKLSALESFIYNYEPAGMDNELKFKEQLSELLAELKPDNITNTGKKDAINWEMLAALKAVKQRVSVVPEWIDFRGVLGTELLAGIDSIISRAEEVVK